MLDTHAFVGTLAKALYRYEFPIRLSVLDKVLHNKCSVPYRDGFDVGSIVAAAYVYWSLRDRRTANAIAYAFRSEYGHPVIAANEPPALIPEHQEV